MQLGFSHMHNHGLKGWGIRAAHFRDIENNLIEILVRIVKRKMG